MAGEAHIKVAIAEIQRAIAEKQQEMQQVRAEFDRKRKSVESSNGKIDRDIALQNALIADGNRTGEERALASVRMNQLRHDVDENRKRLNDINNYYNERIRAMETEVQALNDQINNMNRLR